MPSMHVPTPTVMHLLEAFLRTTAKPAAVPLRGGILYMLCMTWGIPYMLSLGGGHPAHAADVEGVLHVLCMRHGILHFACCE